MVNEINILQPSAASFDPYDQRPGKKPAYDVQNDGIEPGTKFKMLAFDIGQVSVLFDWAGVEVGFAERTGRSLEEVSRAMKELSKLGYESGKINTSDFLAALNVQLKSDITRREFSELWNNTFRLCSVMPNVLDRLSEDFQLVAGSNTNPEHYGFLLHVLNAYRFYKRWVFSHEHGAMKPERSFYREVYGQSDKRIRKNQVLFVDDKPAFVHGARKYGFQAIQFTTADAFIKRITEIGLLT